MIGSEKKAAFQQIYSDHSRDLYSFLLRSLRNEAIAGDLLQDAFLNFIRIYQNKDLPERNVCRMYLFRTARNLMINLARSSRNKKEVTLIDDAPSNASSPEEVFFEAASMKLREEALQELLSTLNEEDSSILQMRYAHGMKLEEIAKIMELSASSISRRLDRARTALVKILKKKEGT